MTELVCCNNKDADLYFAHLMTQKVHFAILFIDEYIDTFLDKFTNIETVYFHGNEKIDLEKKLGYDYNMAFLVQTMTFISHSLIIKYENKLHKLIPETYKYCFSYHKEFPFFRSWPIYLPREPLDKTVMMINPYEKSHEDLIVQLLYSLKADTLKSKGMDVRIYHYFSDAVQLSKVLLPQYPNEAFPMKESDIDLKTLRDHPLITLMKKSTIVNLENLLAASKELILFEVSRYLKIENIGLIFDSRAWDYPRLPVRNRSSQMRNIIVCFAGLVNDKEPYLTYFNRFIQLCKAKGEHVVELTKIHGEYRTIGTKENKLTYSDIFSLISDADLYIGTDHLLAHIAGLFNIQNFIVLFEVPVRYNPPLRNHTVIKLGVNLETMCVEKLYELTTSLKNAQTDLVSSEHNFTDYGTYPTIEL